MDFLSVTTWQDALAARAARPGAWPVAGATDVMVRLNRELHRPEALLDLSRVPELTDWATQNGSLRIGAGMTYARIASELGECLPGLAAASACVGSPQVRHRGTIGGCLGSSSLAGDAHPPLLAADAVVEAASVRGTRRIAVADFFVAPDRNALAADELIAAVIVPVSSGPESFARVAVRPVLATAVASFALRLRPDQGQVGSGVGCMPPVPSPAATAARFLAGELTAAGLWESRGDLGDALPRRFGELIAAGTTPIDDLRASAGYRRHVLAVMARRGLMRAWSRYQEDGRCGSC